MTARYTLLGLLPLCGCLTSEPAPVPPPDLRIVVTTATEYPTAAEAALRTSNVARVPVRDADDLGASRYRMVLVCPDVAVCREAAQRIANDRTFARGVDAEMPNRQRIPVKPSREASR
ncbi:MAG TPA: hypothetical protein VLE45_14020 [Burkholderiaceae bacterium]|nr:hypothetical protein [Burkholderiaceae bacterium]